MKLSSILVVITLALTACDRPNARNPEAAGKDPTVKEGAGAAEKSAPAERSSPGGHEH